MDDDSDDSEDDPAKSKERWKNILDKLSGLKRSRTFFTFLPAILITPFYPLIGFCILIMLIEKIILGRLGIPGLEFTTLATFLFGVKYKIETAILITILIPNIFLKLIKFFLWPETLNPDEGPINLNFSTLLDVIVAVIGYVTYNILHLPLLIGIFFALIVKHSLNILYTINSDKPEVMSAGISFLTNLIFVALFNPLLLKLIRL